VYNELGTCCLSSSTIGFEKPIVDELKQHVPNSLYTCNHPTDNGHQYITNHYINKMDACPEFTNYV